jgi:hypothetical protein
MRPRLGARRLPIAILLALSLTAAADAETLTYGVDAGLGESDNITLVPTNKVSQTMAIADVDFDFKQLSRRLDVDAKGNFTYLDYIQGAYSGQLIGRFDGAAHLALIPERLSWVLQDDFGQVAVDPFAPQTPGNLENVNYVSTGPDLALRLGGTGFLNMSARVARAEYATSPFNSNRLQGSFAWGLHLSAQSSVSVNGDTERVLFENTVVNTDFERTNGFLRYEVQGARTGFSADLGATRVSEGGQGGQATTGPLARINLTRKLSSASQLTLSVGRDLTDGSTSFSTLQSGAIGVVGTAPAALTSASYTSEYGSVLWQYERNRTTVNVSARWGKDVYNGAPQFDVTRDGAEFRVQRQITRALNAEILGRFYKTVYLNPIAAFTLLNGAINFDDELIGGALTWRHGRGLEVKLRVDHSARTTPGVDSGFRENRVFLTVGYRPFVRRPSDNPGAYTLQ